jgi:hypothetical protein
MLLVRIEQPIEGQLDIIISEVVYLLIACR